MATTRILIVLADPAPRSTSQRHAVRLAELLSSLGFDARTWLPGAPTTEQLGADDILVVPDAFGDANDPAPGCRKVILVAESAPVESATWDSVVALWSADPGLDPLLTRVLPDVPVHRLPLWVDTNRFRPAAASARAVAYRSGADRSAGAAFARVLATESALEGWEVTALDGRSDDEVVAVLARASVFVALPGADPTGLGRLEAEASGCRVVAARGDLLALGAATVQAAGQPPPAPAGDLNVESFRDAVEALLAAAASSSGGAGTATHPVLDQGLRATLATLRARAGRAEAEARARRHELDSLARSDLGTLQAALREAEARVEELERSTSWRITAPLRRASEIVRRR